MIIFLTCIDVPHRGEISKVSSELTWLFTELHQLER